MLPRDRQLAGPPLDGTRVVTFGLDGWMVTGPGDRPCFNGMGAVWTAARRGRELGLDPNITYEGRKPVA